MVVYHLGSFFWPRIAIGKVSFIRATKDAPLRNLNTNRNIVFFCNYPIVFVSHLPDDIAVHSRQIAIHW